MKIHISDTCQACDGDCFVVHPLWKQYHAQHGQLNQADFFGEAGYLPTDTLPEMMIPCPTCKGTGEVATWVPVARFLEMVQRLGHGIYKILGGAPL